MKEITEPEMLRKMAAYCSATEHCKQDVRKKIEAAGLPVDAASRIINRLEEEKFIDESRYAHFFVKDKLRFNKWGRIKIKYELYQKEIPSSIQENALRSIDDDEYRVLLLDLLVTKKRTIKGKDPYEMNNKLLRFATSRGFESHLVIDCLRRMDNGTGKELDLDDLE